MQLFKVFLAIAWIALLYVAINAFGSEGMRAAEIFFGDMQTSSWRSMFNVELLGHLSLVALWVAWREKFSASGIVFGLLCVLVGGLFSFVYVLALSVHNKGDTRQLLLGKHCVS